MDRFSKIVLSMVLFTISVLFLACETSSSSGGSDTATGNDSYCQCDWPKECDDIGQCVLRPDYCESDKECPDGMICFGNAGSNKCQPEPGACGNGVCGDYWEFGVKENCANCDIDCVCGAGYRCSCITPSSYTCGLEYKTAACVIDELTDYYWLEGQWQCVSANDKPCENFVNVTITSWDPVLGAEVHGFQPLNMSYIKKNPGTDEFILNVTAEDGSYGKGSADKDTNTVDFTYHNAVDDYDVHMIYKK